MVYVADLLEEHPVNIAATIRAAISIASTFFMIVFSFFISYYKKAVRPGRNRFFIPCEAPVTPLLPAAGVQRKRTPPEAGQCQEWGEFAQRNMPLP